ncbi:MAG: hypothetical protein HC933_12630 [Pleurocapsa sp. SU_196_0]|nr:hypothetical protein [Pleurocapsa sp. SU_196_0]
MKTASKTACITHCQDLSSSLADDSWPRKAQTARLQELKALIDVGLESADAGRVFVVNDDVIDDIKRCARGTIT